MSQLAQSTDPKRFDHSQGPRKIGPAEGKSVETPYRGPVENTLGEIMGGVRSAQPAMRAD